MAATIAAVAGIIIFGYFYIRQARHERRTNRALRRYSAMSEWREAARRDREAGRS